MQLDTGNAMRGGLSNNDIIDILRRYPGRAVTIHLKEYSSKDKNALIGEGEVDWKNILKFCEKVGGTEWYIVEQESYKYPPLKCVEICLKNLLEILK